MKLTLSLLLCLYFCFPRLVMAEVEKTDASEIINKSDAIRSPNSPFRYTVTLLEYKTDNSQVINKQILDISMRFIRGNKDTPAEAKSLVRFIYPARDKGKVMLSDWYQLWFYTPELRRPITISREQRLLGQISNSDVIVTNFADAYRARRLEDIACGKLRCYQLDLERISPQVTYPKVIYLVEKESFRPFKASYYSLDNRLMKTVLYQNYRMFLGKNRPAKIVVTDARQKTGFTVMEYSDVRYESLPSSYFTKEYILRGGN